MPTQSLYEPVTLLASAARTASGNGSAVRLLEGMERVRAVAFVLDVTAAATDAGDTLDVAVQVKLDGSNWLPVVSFAQVLGNGGAKRYVEKVVAGAAESGFEYSAALAAGSTRNLLGLETRVAWAIVDSGDADQSFTFSVSAVAM